MAAARHVQFATPTRASNPRRTSLFTWLRSVVLPAAYPHGLAPGYLTYQCFDTLQGLCSYLRGVVCTKAVLTGMGVGSTAATATSATLNYLMRDGASMIGSLVLASSAAESFGRNVKAWRLFADVVNDIGLTLELFAPLWAPGPVFIIGLMTASVLKAWCGVAAGATKAAITQHFSLRAHDVADLAAKEGSQETIVSLLGLVLGWGVAGLEDAALVRALFAALTVVHVVANYCAVRAVHLRDFNWERLEIALDGCSKGETHIGPQDVSALESIWPPRPRVRVVFGPTPGIEFTPSPWPDVVCAFAGDATAFIAAKRRASSSDVLACCVHVLTRWDGAPCDKAVAQLQRAGWNADAALLGDAPERRVDAHAF